MLSHPIRGICPAGCPAAASGAARILRASVTMNPTVLHRMVVSSRRPHADLLLPYECSRTTQLSCRAGLASLHVRQAAMAGPVGCSDWFGMDSSSFHLNAAVTKPLLGPDGGISGQHP